MIDPADAARAFDAAFAGRAPGGLRVRPETGDDETFLRELFLATYALRDVLPEPLLTQQADFQLAAFRHGSADAMRRIVVGPGAPVGRIIIDWNHPGGTHCIDIAIRPSEGGRGVGTALLRSWMDVAAGHGLACSLAVAPDNPARALYARLGFRETTDNSGSASLTMLRPPRP
ncbi:MAG TPA: GNAT family N-acetyltransferase [Caulobacteraceae bacterium]|nr:GNAT family N-acetyltransferase [Caulobacteraceae bacterium]